jgi:hypothetical protein
VLTLSVSDGPHDRRTVTLVVDDASPRVVDRVLTLPEVRRTTLVA